MRFKITIAYDGTNFSGFQIQPKDRTVQEVLERALKKIAKGDFDRIYGSGRTDSGVHAYQQVAHFDFPFPIQAPALIKALNTSLPDDVTVTAVEEVADDFHAQYHAKEKTYLYRVRNAPYKDPFTRRFTYWHPYPLSIEKMQVACDQLVGLHDFTSYASTKSTVQSKVREIYEARVWREEESSEVHFLFRGNGFLYNQVRVMVGTLLQIGDGRRSLEDMPKILEAKDREAAGPTAPPEGLFLMNVNYD